MLLPGIKGRTMSRMELQNVVRNLERVQRGETKVILGHGRSGEMDSWPPKAGFDPPVPWGNVKAAATALKAKLV